jgi:hypothetical protein
MENDTTKEARNKECDQFLAIELQAVDSEDMNDSSQRRQTWWQCYLRRGLSTGINGIS